MNLLAEGTLSFRGGMRQAGSLVQYRADEVELLENWHARPDGSAYPRGGTQRKATGPVGTAYLESAWGRGVGTLWKNDGADGEDWLGVWNKTMYRSTNRGLTWAGIAVDFTTSTRIMRFAEMTYLGAPHLLMVNGGGGWIWNGTTFSALANMPAGVQHLAVFNERLWVTGSGDNPTVWASKIADPTVFAIPDGLSIRVQPHGGGGRNMGLLPLRDVMLVFKRSSTAFVDGYGDSDLVVAAGSRGISGTTGCVAPRSAVNVGGGRGMWLSERGIEFYQQGGEAEVISDGIKDIVDDAIARTGNLPMVPTGMYVAERDEYWLALPVDDNENTVLVVVNVETKAISLDRFTTQAQNGTSARGIGSLFMSRPSGYGELQPHAQAPWDGLVRRLDVGTMDDVRTDGSLGYLIHRTALSRPHAFRAPFAQKRVRGIDATGVATDPARLDLAVVVDGEESRPHSREIRPGNRSRPVRARVLVRGTQVQSMVRSTDPVTLRTMRVQAEPLRERV